MRDKSLPGRLFTALLWFAGALTIVDYGSALAQLGVWEELGIPLTYRLNAGGSILFYLLAACCCLLVFLYVEAELGRTWMEDGRRLALSAAPVTLLLLVLLTARDENGFCYLDAEGLRGSTLFWGEAGGACLSGGCLSPLQLDAEPLEAGNTQGGTENPAAARACAGGRLFAARLAARARAAVLRHYAGAGVCMCWCCRPSLRWIP